MAWEKHRFELESDFGDCRIIQDTFYAPLIPAEISRLERFTLRNLVYFAILIDLRGFEKWFQKTSAFIRQSLNIN